MDTLLLIIAFIVLAFIVTFIVFAIIADVVFGDQFEHRKDSKPLPPKRHISPKP